MDLCLQQVMICPKCLHPLTIGSWPFCGGRNSHEGGGRGGAISDSLRGGLIMEHLEPGRKVYSKSELKRVLASHGFQLDETNCDTERGKDKIHPKWF